MGTRILWVTAVVFAVVLSFGLFGCGGSQGSASTSSASVASASASTSSGSAASSGTLASASFDNVVLVNNDYATVKLVGFSQKEHSNGVSNVITLNITNKTDGDFLCNMEVYLNDKEMTPSIVGGTNGSPRPGKNADVSYDIGTGTAGDFKSIDSFDDLYNLELAFNFMSSGSNGLPSEKTDLIKLSDLVSK